MITKVVHWMLTLALVYGAYTETGIFTALCLLLIFISIEVLVLSVKRVIHDGRIMQDFIDDTLKAIRK